MIGKSWRISGI